MKALVRVCEVVALLLCAGRMYSQLGLDNWTYILADNSRAPSPFNQGMFGLSFGDLNGDGFKDIASGAYFYRNPGGDMTSAPWPRVTLPVNSLTNHLVDAGLLFDAEGTGQLNDIIAEDLPSVIWLKANDAQGDSWTPTVIAQIPATSHGNGRTIKSAHIISANTKPDILLTGGDGIYLMAVPADPTAGSWPITRITTPSNGEQKTIGIGDIDRSGTLDIAVAHGADQLVVDWWSNPGDGTNTWVQHTIGSTDATAKMIEVADINNDGRLDVIVSEEASPASVYWFEAPADLVNGTWTRHTVATGLGEVDSMSAIDMNGDGKPDITIGEIFGSKQVIIYENINDGASWNAHVVDSGKESHNGARAVDLDGDGDMDLVSIAYFSYWQMHVWRNNAAPLPIQLATFTAMRLSAQQVRLDWQTISETNNYGFQVQRKDTGVSGFETIPNSFIAGHGTTLEPHHYQFVDSTSDISSELYRLQQIDLDGSVHYTEGISVNVATSVAEKLPASFSLSQNYPNPFNPETTITYQLRSPSHVTLRVFDVLGREISKLVDDILQPGYKSVRWNASNVPSGVYFYQLRAGAFVETQKMLLMK